MMTIPPESIPPDDWRPYTEAELVSIEAYIRGLKISPDHVRLFPGIVALANTCRRLWATLEQATDETESALRAFGHRRIDDGPEGVRPDGAPPEGPLLGQ